METKRLILRRFEYGDSAAMLKNWIADPRIQSMYSEPVYRTETEVRGLLDKWICSYDRTDFYRFAVVERSRGECIGQIAFFLVDSKNNFGELEYCIGDEFQRKGYCTEAVKAMCEFGFADIGFHKIQVCHKENNPASRGVIQKCGFTYEGMLRDFFFMDGAYVSRLYYSMLKSEYEDMVCLVPPSEELEAAALDYRSEHFDAGETVINGSALFDRIESYGGWLEHVRRNADRKTVRPDWVPSSTFFGVRRRDGRIVGIIDIRHELNDCLRECHGHIGYAVRPSERRKGYATQMLKLALEHCRTLGLDEVMLGCYKDNDPSVRTIKKCGGIVKEEKPYLDGRPMLVFRIELRDG
ncbi:MAG: GNAT family N-acetyltransferase [Candidatus Methanoplasma sp.]|jgi:ribosomal-protein-alanine N-acetyltransferase|nr:GNAT family N-acetyltransferase [Candidatus Methanoplasma sp.]